MSIKHIILAAAVAVFSFPVLAADITAKNVARDKVTQPRQPWVWEQVNNDDTTKEQAVIAGLYQYHVEGTEDNADFKLQHGKTAGSLEDIDTDQMPDGVRYSSASTGNSVNVCLTEGFADISFTSVGTSAQDIDIWMTFLGEC